MPPVAAGKPSILHIDEIGPVHATGDAVGYPSGMTSLSSHGPGPGAPGASYTWDDFIALEEDDLRELIDGELVEVEVPTYDHERIVMRVGHHLTAWSDAGHGGVALASGYKVRVSDRRGLMPDVQFYSKGNIPPPDQKQGLVRGRADLVVEIVSPSSRRYDRVKKLNWYAQLGVPEYWIVDPEARTLERLVLRPSDGVYVIAASLEGEESFRPESFEGLEISLAKLFE
jgi:Uma2 family endonuclease